VLSLSGCGIGAAGAHALARIISCQYVGSSPQDIDSSSGKKSSTKSKKKEQVYFKPACSILSNLCSLDLSSNELQDEGVSALCGALAFCGKKGIINDDDMDLSGGEGGGVFGPCVVTAPVSSLMHLDLSNNKITSSGCATLSSTLRLIAVNISTSSSSSSSSLFSSSLSSSSSSMHCLSGLQSLNLDDNVIDGDGFLMLVDAITNRAVLKKSDGNNVRKVYSSPLLRLSLRGNTIADGLNFIFIFLFYFIFFSYYFIRHRCD
jgi:hypothetical protein